VDEHTLSWPFALRSWLTLRPRRVMLRTPEVPMRHIVAAMLFVLAGCTAQGLPIDDSTGGGGAGGASSVDMAKRDLGGSGATCKSACDCEAGLACRMGTCGMSNLGPVYCCDSGQCPAGSFCQSATGGFAQCGSSGGGGSGGGNGGGPGTGGGPGGGGGGFGGGPGGGGPDAGLGMFCSQIPCTSNGNVCKMIGCGACTAAGTCGQ
jgi:hypothetical protein